MPDHAADRPYGDWNVLDQWDSVSFDDLTRAVLARRLAPPPPPRFLDAAAMRTLSHACARLLATPVDRPPIAARIDADLADGAGEGFRLEGERPPREAWPRGLAGLDDEARRRHGAAFAELPAWQQDDTLRALQRGEAASPAFDGVDPARFFTHALLKAAAAHFYARPEAWSEIGFGGPASPRGYVRLGLDRRDDREAPMPPRPDPRDDPPAEASR